MVRTPLRRRVMRTYVFYILSRTLIMPPKDLQHFVDQLKLDYSILLVLAQTRYLRGRTPIAKAGNLHLAWEYTHSPDTFDRFTSMLRVTPESFQFILELIQDHPVFMTRSHRPQTPVEIQLGVTLYRMGRYGNGASVRDIARTAGISEGAVERFTARCFTALYSHHNEFVRKLTGAEVEREKAWVEEQSGLTGWREGWVMYDGTIVPLYQKPGLNGDAYYTRKCNYGLNVQIGNVPSNLRIVDYAHGMTGSAHDASAFEHTAASRYTDWLFSGNEFAWTDSAYTLNARTICVHKRPANLQRWNAAFDAAVAHLRVRSEHTMGALKGRFQCLRGLRVQINSKRDHVEACRWASIAIILHNIVVELEGTEWSNYYITQHDMREEPRRDEFDNAEDVVLDAVRRNDGEARRQLLIDELIEYRTNMD